MMQYLGCASSVFSDKVERPELAETLEELHDVFFVQISRQTADEHFVDGIGDVGGYDTWNMDTRRGHIHSTIIFRTTDFKRAVDEDDAVEGHRGCSIFCAAELCEQRRSADILPHGKKRLANLNERVVLFVVALYREDRVTRSSGPNAHFNHLRVEEVSQILLIDVWGDAANVETARLARKVRVGANSHAEGLDRHRGREARNTKDGRDLRAVGAWEVEKT